jgi:opacity protein-like surface antigen
VRLPRRLVLALLAGATALGGARALAADEAGAGEAPPEAAGVEAEAPPADEPPLARTGPYLGAAAFFAANDFDTTLSVDDTWGGRWLVGYRFHPYVAGELRGEVFSHFDLNGSRLTADLEGWSASAHAKLYAFTGRFQPYFTLGLGGFVGDLRVEDKRTGAHSHDDEAVEIFRMGLGLDVPVSEHLFVNFEGTYAVLGDELDGANFGQVGLGLGYRF